MVQTIPFAFDAHPTNIANPANIRVANACPAQAMAPAERRDLALRALGGTFTISDTTPRRWQGEAKLRQQLHQGLR